MADIEERDDFPVLVEQRVERSDALQQPQETALVGGAPGVDERTMSPPRRAGVEEREARQRKEGEERNPSVRSTARDAFTPRCVLKNPQHSSKISQNGETGMKGSNPIEIHT